MTHNLSPITCRYVPREELAPYFGYATPATQTVLIRDDLPNRVQRFLLAHELYHLGDPARLVLWREIKANAAGLRACPWGGLQCLWMSLTDADRWRLYLKRFREGS